MDWKSNPLLQRVRHWIMPEYCIGCGEKLPLTQHFLCPYCLNDLPRIAGLDVYYRPEKVLEGKVPFAEFRADLVFDKRTLVQQLVHLVKYAHKPKLARWLVRHFFTQQLQQGHYADVSVVVPVPMLPHKYSERWYNPAEVIAHEVATLLGVELITHVLKRTDTGTQKKKNREGRWENIAFQCEPNSLQGKRVLVVDDVCTTGATLCAVGKALLESSGAESLSFYTLTFDALK